MAVATKSVKEDKKQEHRMYRGKVKMVFNPDSPRYRYTVTDQENGFKEEPIRGVTTLLKDIIAKPALMTWAMNMSHKVLFATHFDEASLEYVHDWEKALIKPDTAYSAEELHEAMMAGAREYTNRSDQGKDVGTIVHGMCESYLKGRTYVMEEDVPETERKMANKAFQSFKGWWESLKHPMVEFTEMPVYSRRFKYAGTCDVVAMINGRRYLLDIKTTNVSKVAPMGIYAEYFVQLAGYSYAVREEHGLTFDDIGVIRVGKDGKLNIVTARDIGLTIDDCERAFAFACRLHDWLETSSKFLSDARMTSHLNPAAKVEAQPANNLEGGSASV